MVGVAKATEKRSTFSPSGGVCQAVAARWARTPCSPCTSTHFQVRKQANMDLRGGWNQPPQGGISRLVLAGWKVTSYVLVNAFIRHECIGVYVFSSFSVSERAVSSTPSSSKHQMEPVSVSVKDEPNVLRVTGSFGTWSHQTHNSSEAKTVLGYGWSPGRIRSSGPLELAQLIGT